MTPSHSDHKGKVYLVGAGPGEPGLITLRGVDCLRRADLVLFDYLVNPQILEHAPGQAELICLGRHGHGRIWTQSEINARMVKASLAGQVVVRLKGGDPAVFARGAEELETLAAAEIPFEIVPGITAALAAGSCAGIPVTHRNLASAVALVTAQEQSDKPETDIDYDALARFPGTVVMYMGVTTAPVWTGELMRAGKPADTPVAAIRRCSWPDQIVIRCTLGELAKKLTVPQKVRPPVIVIIGPVTSLPEKLSWFEQRPLCGVRILVSRAPGQAEELRNQLGQLGADVLVQPAIQISAPPDWQPVDDAIARLDDFDWLVFSSSNGVRYFFDRLFELGHDLRLLHRQRLAAIGPSTAAELARYRLRCDVQPSEFRAEALAALLAPAASGKQFLLLRASRGREVLSEQLSAAGGIVTQAVVYTSSDVKSADEHVVQLLTSRKIDWITVTSSAIARSLVAMFGPDLQLAKVGSISPITSATLRELGVQPDVEASQYTMDGLVAAILQAER